MTTIESQLLQLILRETVRVEALSPHRDWHDHDPKEWVNRWQAIQDLREGLGVRVCGNWIGTDAASRKARQRGLQSLERAGLVKLSAAWGRFITHIMFTDEGRTLAESLAIERVLP